MKRQTLRVLSFCLRKPIPVDRTSLLVHLGAFRVEAPALTVGRASSRTVTLARDSSHTIGIFTETFG